MKPKQVSRRDTNSRQWRERMARWRASGLSKAAFCRQESLSVASFHYWHRILAQPAHKDSATLSRFVPVKVSEPLGELRVQIGDVVLCCSEAVSAEQLSRWVNALRRALCTL